MELLRSQLNELYTLVVDTGYFSPTQFDKSATGTEFRLTGTAFYFKIFENSGYANSLIVNFSPGEILYKDASSSIVWKDVKEYFKKWLKYLKREVSSPDKWGRAFDEAQYLIGGTVDQNLHFTHDEYLLISSQIQTIKTSLDRIPLLQEQTIAIKNQLDHLLELTAQLNKFDWQNLLIGTIISIVVQLGVSKDNAVLLYELIKNTFHKIFLK